ncbi:hypothetical protein NIES2111_67680 (plasmid) [Nostoc sp. NIES-2111]|nr:hypothetical protein NIES2111_67680 [Nostoc sp. NIES-2111]
MTTKIFATLMLVTGLSFATQVLPSAHINGGSVLSNSQQDGDLYMAKNHKPEDMCHPDPCKRPLSE